MKVEIYSDIACPWCYIGERRFFRALQEFEGRGAVEVVFRPFQLDPALSATSRPLVDTLQAKFGSNLEPTLRHTAATARNEGLTFDFHRARAVNTLRAHRLLWHVLRTAGPDAQHRMADRLFRAYFSEGKDVGDIETLVALASESGLVDEPIRAFLQSDDGTADVREEIDHAQRIGVRAVPTFVFDGESAVQGAQPAEVFLQVLEEVADERSVPRNE